MATANTKTTGEFLGLSADEDTLRLTMKDHLLGGGSGSLFGGVGLAVGLIALESRTEQPPVYMTCQFAATVSPPAELVFSTELLAKGRTASQGRVTASCDDRTILAMVGATGQRREDHRAIWRGMPETAPPDACAPLVRSQENESLHDHVEVRMARGMFGFAPEGAPGRGKASGDASTLFWARMPDVQHDAAALALMADYLPSGVGNSVERTSSVRVSTTRFDSSSQSRPTPRASGCCSKAMSSS